MKNTIEKVLSEYADSQVNLGSESARKFLAEKIGDRLTKQIARIFSKHFEELLSESRRIHGKAQPGDEFYPSPSMLNFAEDFDDEGNGKDKGKDTISSENSIILPTNIKKV